MLGGKIKRPHYEACKFKGFEFVRTLKVSKGRATVFYGVRIVALIYHRLFELFGAQLKRQQVFGLLPFA